MSNEEVKETRNRNRVKPSSEKVAPADSPKKATAGDKAEAPPLIRIDGRTLLGGISALMSLLLLISFISFLFTWKEDADLLVAQDSSLVQSDVVPQNAAGRLGMFLSDSLLNRGFGLGAFGLVYLMGVLAIRLLVKNTGIQLVKHIFMSLVLMVSVSLSLSYLVNFVGGSELVFPGGGFGYFLTGWMIGFMGIAGSGIFLLLFWTTFSLIAFKVQLSVEMFSRQKDEVEDAQPEDEAEVKASETRNRIREEAEDRLLRELQTKGKEEPELEEEEEDLPEPSLAFKKEVIDFGNPADLIRKTPEPPKELELELIPNTPKMEEPEPEHESRNPLEEMGPYDPRLDLSSYQFPEVDLLIEHSKGKVSVSEEDLKRNSAQIVETLGHYNIEISKITAKVGPTVTLYEIIPAPGVKISKIKNLEDDIALSLAALGIRIIAPMPGAGTIGIEVPNRNKEVVSMRAMLNSDKFRNSGMALPIALGKTIQDEIYIADLAKMPHLLIAGATGQGKSVGLNAILVSLLYKKHPAELKLVLVDPKKVELSLFSHIERHFLAKLPGEDDSIITDTQKVVSTLNSLTFEMDRRYDLLKDAGVRNLTEYNQKFTARRLNPNEGHRYMPYIVLVVDEFADMMMTAGKEVERPISRLAQLARAVGIHLIIATQRPSVNIITGTIKANFPARIAFKVTTVVDSRTILDTGGAHQLIGSGDMLLSLNSNLIRLQCPFVDTVEVEKVAEFIGSQRGYPDAFLLPEVSEDGEVAIKEELSASTLDPLFEEAARTLVLAQQGSTSLLQRKLKLGYNRAGRLIDQLEAAGIVGPFEGSKAREVLIPDEYALEQHLIRFRENLK